MHSCWRLKRLFYSLLYTIWCKSFFLRVVILKKPQFLSSFFKIRFTLLTNKRFGVVQHLFYFLSQTRRLGFPIYNSKQQSCHSFHFCIDCIFLFVIFNSYIYMYIYSFVLFHLETKCLIIFYWVHILVAFVCNTICRLLSVW